MIRVSDDLAADIQAARPLADDGRTLLPWVVLATLLAAILLFAGGAALARRQLPAPRPEAA